jgi:hypothetical protein
MQRGFPTRCDAQPAVVIESVEEFPPLPVVASASARTSGISAAAGPCGMAAAPSAGAAAVLSGGVAPMDSTILGQKQLADAAPPQGDSRGAARVRVHAAADCAAADAHETDSQTASDLSYGRAYVQLDEEALGAAFDAAQQAALAAGVDMPPDVVADVAEGVLRRVVQLLADGHCLAAPGAADTEMFTCQLDAYWDRAMDAAVLKVGKYVDGDPARGALPTQAADAVCAALDAYESAVQQELRAHWAGRLVRQTPPCSSSPANAGAAPRRRRRGGRRYQVCVCVMLQRGHSNKPECSRR